MTKILVADPWSDFIEVEMNGATTIKYASVRAAEACGYDGDDVYWWVADMNDTFLPEDAIIANYDGQRLVLAPRSFEEL